jgi:hypothetical protein
MPDEYELFPVDEISKLKEELEGLKNKPLDQSSEGNNLLSAVTELNETMTNMMDLFKSASDNVKSEGSAHEKILDKLDKVVDQNTKIAKALIAIADLVKGKEKPITRPSAPRISKPVIGPDFGPGPAPPGLGPVPTPSFGPGPMPPLPEPSPINKGFPSLPSGPDVMPPPPPKKKGFFSRFKK